MTPDSQRKQIERQPPKGQFANGWADERALMLESTTEKLWQQYLDAEKKQIRRVLLPALERFIDALLEEEEVIWHRWAFDLSAQVSDAGIDVPIRYPLIERVLRPALTDGVLRGIPGCVRWLSRFGPSPHDVRFPEHLRTTVGLLQEAIRIDPADQIARERLVQLWASTLEYSLHELPAGVLYGHNGATVPECDELLEFLEEFRAHAASLNQPSQFSRLIADCDLHFRSYRDYLVQGRPGCSYEQFLETRRPTEDCC